METISLKALSNKVLQRNRQGNLKETASKYDGNFQGFFEGKSFPVSNKVSGQFPEAAFCNPEDRYNYEERAAIMQFDGGMTQEEAEKQAWCREVCMLTAGQAELCEKINPCPRYQSSTTKRRV